jgi:nitric oxide dioxygenase
MVQLPDGLHQVRQYSLSADAGTSRTFTTKLNDGGEVSAALHNGVEPGDILQISNPYGEITLKEGNGPLVLASAGIGCTPTASILRSLAETATGRRVLVLHAESSLESWALRGQMTDDVERIDDAELQLWLEQPHPGARPGFMSLRDVDLPADASLYLCGPLPFMKKIRNEAVDAGIPATRIHYEVFGPDVWLAN